MPMSDFYSAPSNSIMYTISIKSGEILIMEPNCLNFDFRYKIFKWQWQIHIQHLQID